MFAELLGLLGGGSKSPIPNTPPMQPLDPSLMQSKPMPNQAGIQMPTGQNFSPTGIKPNVAPQGFAQFVSNQSQNYDKGGLFGMLAQMMGGNKNG